ncbi:TPA: hypothetical protein HIR38_004765, partial [Escherichia coli]|nr:hypothetical protein [Escherichia coli]
MMIILFHLFQKLLTVIFATLLSLSLLILGVVVKLNKTMTAFLLFSLSFSCNVRADASLATNTFTSELSGVINRKLISLGADAAAISATLSGYSRAAASFASNYAASIGISSSAMTWSTLAYGLGVTTVSIGIYAVGKPFAEEIAKLALEKNGYNAFFSTPAMSSGSKVWIGGLSSCGVATSTSPFSTASQLLNCLPADSSPSLTRSYYTPKKSIGSLEGYTFYYISKYNGRWSESPLYVYSSVLGSDSDTYCDQGQVLFTPSGGSSSCIAAVTENPFSSDYSTPVISGNNLASQDIADILNGLTKQLDGLSSYDGVSSSSLYFTASDVDNYRSTVDMSGGDSGGFTGTGEIAIPPTPEGDTESSGGKYTPPVVDPDFTPVSGNGSSGSSGGTG